MEYEINEDTLYILPTGENSCRVVEKSDEYKVFSSAYDVMDHSCMYFGSSMDGRLSGSKNVLGSIYKVPIVVEESMSIIFFPTSSVNSSKNIWISVNNIVSYEKFGKKTRIFFRNNKDFIVDIPYYSVKNQVVRCAMLESIIRKRKNAKKSDYLY